MHQQRQLSRMQRVIESHVSITMLFGSSSLIVVCSDDEFFVSSQPTGYLHTGQVLFDNSLPLPNTVPCSLGCGTCRHHSHRMWLKLRQKKTSSTLYRLRQLTTYAWWSKVLVTTGTAARMVSAVL